MTHTRKKLNTASAREMRRAVAYSRLAAKAFRAGDIGAAEAHAAQAIRLSNRADYLRETGR